ncbi:MAG: phage portal protein, partial [Gammaproteobacteria bacterium]|nr:phage portal protein [Gammaproteobacteria bacterium]
MRSSAVWGCIRVLSSSIGSLPLVVYERTDKGRRVAREHHLYSMLHDAPNQSMSSMTWRQVQQVHVTATGNSYAYIKRGERTKRPQEIIPLMPSSVTPIRKNGEILYEITLDNGEKQTVDAWRILHIPGMGFDGLVGYSPIRMAADNIGLSLAAQEFGGKFFGNGASPGGVLEHPKNIGDQAWERVKAGFNDSYGGLGNAHKTLIL